MKISRRSAIKKSLIATAGATIGSAISNETLASENTPSSKTYDFKRQIKVSEKYDLVVAGGGPAGTVAAVCAARLGANQTYCCYLCSGERLFK